MDRLVVVPATKIQARTREAIWMRAWDDYSRGHVHFGRLLLREYMVLRMRHLQAREMYQRARRYQIALMKGFKIGFKL